MNRWVKNLNLLIVIFLLLALSFGAYDFYQKRVTPVSMASQPVNEVKGGIVPGFPEFPLLYPGAEIDSTQITAASGQQPVSYQAYLESEDGVEKIIQWYSENLKNSGWNQERPIDSSQPNDQNLTVNKNGMKATVNVELEDSGSSISIYIQ